jgi:hypothetical protein
LKSRALLNDSPGAGYLERKWPEPFKKTGAWPLAALRQAFLNGTLERLLDPDMYLRNRLPEFVMRGDFGLASGQTPEGRYSRVWLREMLPLDEISFDSDVYLLLAQTAEAQKAAKASLTAVELQTQPSSAAADGAASGPLFEPPAQIAEAPEPAVVTKSRSLHISGEIPTEVWQRLGRTLIPKLKSGTDLHVGLDISLSLDSDGASGLRREIEQILQDLKLEGKVKVEWI